MIDVLKVPNNLFNKELLNNALKKTLSYKSTNKEKRIRETKITTKTRRGNGQGCITKRKDGRWCGIATIGYNPNGKIKRKYVYGHSESEVVKKLSLITNRVKLCDYMVIENNTFNQLLLNWLMIFKKNAVTSRTFEGNIANYKHHIKPYFKHLKLYEVNHFVVQQFINSMIENGYALETIKKNKFILGQFFEFAIDNEWIDKNPILKIKLKANEKDFRRGKGKYKALSPQDREYFLNCLDEEDSYIGPLCKVLMFSGLRIGEVCALKWKDLDFNKRTINVERGITQTVNFDEMGNIVGRENIIGTTKTMCSVRNLPMTEYLCYTLKAWQKKCFEEDKINNEFFVFGGEVFTNSDKCRRKFDRFKKKYNLENLKIGFHGLRHTFSNMLFEMKENPKAIQQLLGHRDVKTTISIYNSVDNNYLIGTTNRLNERIKNNQFFKV